MGHSRYWRLAAITVVACGTAGLVAEATGTDARLTAAMYDAHAAAEVLEASRARLEATLAESQAAAARAATVTTVGPVASALLAMDATVTVAGTAASHYGLPLRDATMRGPSPFARTPALAPVPPLPADDQTDQVAAPAAAKATHDAEPAPASSPRETPEPTANSAPSPVPVVTETPSPQEERDRVLAGEEGDADRVQQATEDITRAAQELEEKADQVDASAETLEATAAAAVLAKAVQRLEDANQRGQDALEEAAQLDDLVASDVAAPVLLTSLHRALAALEDAVSTEVDLGSTPQVERQARVTETAVEDLIQAASGVKSSHVAWVSWQNAWVELENRRLEAEYEQALEDTVGAREVAIAAAVAQYADGWWGPPAGIEGENGLLDEEQLCEISYAPGHLLHCDAAAALEEADAAYFEETGFHLTFTDSYRTYAAQVVTRALKGALAATPGLSNHGWGMAVDFDSAAAEWLAEHGTTYGWVHPSWAQTSGSKPEWWHFEFVAPGVGEAVAPPAPVLLDRVESRLPDGD